MEEVHRRRDRDLQWLSGEEWPSNVLFQLNTVENHSYVNDTDNMPEVSDEWLAGGYHATGESDLPPALGRHPSMGIQASANLPPTLLLFGAIDHFFPGDPRAYRVVFAVLHSLLAAFVAFFVFKMWNLKPSPQHLILAASFGLFSPILLCWGTAIPEDKGFQILLMLSALYYARTQRLVLSAILLGGPIAFKGLGVFIAPLCAWYIASRPFRLSELVSRPVVTRCALYTAITILVLLR